MYFWVFAGDGDSHRRRRKTEGKKTFQIPWFFSNLQWRRVNPRTANGGGAWRRRVATVFVVQKDSPAIPGVLGAILQILNCFM